MGRVPPAAILALGAAAACAGLQEAVGLALRLKEGELVRETLGEALSAVLWLRVGEAGGRPGGAGEEKEREGLPVA